MRAKYTYKVWIEVEKQNLTTGMGEDWEADLPFASEAEFSTEEEARAYAMTLHRVSQNIVLVENEPA